MTKYFKASKISEKKAYKILKERANGLSKEKAYNILAFLGCKPTFSKTKYFPAYKISKKKTQGLMGFNPMKKYFTPSKISEKKVYR